MIVCIHIVRALMSVFTLILVYSLGTLHWLYNVYCSISYWQTMYFLQILLFVRIRMITSGTYLMTAMYLKLMNKLLW